ncbi:MAG: hypothetical protein A2991_02540 [Candidatus Terrybacteria bacterium RIFCSPLOWO2_01_FULL_58_14]|uniref:SGNH hydrolase-type esterase domain-containing protein n=2 Tax=Candidatus Terryibacteriota TaxID=1817920 RepID=A0A1G2PXE0_9BACT|nr:MAG: hypothetical protein A2682_01305 [Candidatus Terrybacteria bacterium RIFCSPHIGHO2_01_FULL_58_15]OHA52976.1 MAG: hypothetical protein A2991_02540 [Candidatus Terrybacteria bacterium RIFCSPLOWO2_01_FULL_58_14]
MPFPHPDISRSVFAFLVAAELLIIVVIGEQLFSPLRPDPTALPQEAFPHSETSSLQHFYEPRPREEPWGWEDNDATPYRINADTLNDRFDYLPDKPADTFRIIALGDSFTYGLFVPTAESWPERFEDLLSEQSACPGGARYEVLNFGVPGYDIAYSVERFLLRGKKYDPDLVLFLLSADDSVQVNEVMREKYRGMLDELRKTQGEQAFTEKGTAYRAYLQAWRETSEELGERNIMERHRRSFETLTGEFADALVLYYLPRWGQWESEGLVQRFRTLLETFAAEREKVLFTESSISGDKREPGNDLVLTNDPHPSPKGHLAIAQEILSYLKDQNLLPCP